MRVKAVKAHIVWGHIKEYFKPEEFTDPYNMDAAFLYALYKIRLKAGVPLRITSSIRSPEHNETVGGAKGSAHMLIPGCAVDLFVKNNYERFKIVKAAILEGIERIGIYPAKEDNSGVIHLDMSPSHPQERIWTRY